MLKLPGVQLWGPPSSKFCLPLPTPPKAPGIEREDPPISPEACLMSPDKESLTEEPVLEVTLAPPPFTSPSPPVPTPSPCSFYYPSIWEHRITNLTLRHIYKALFSLDSSGLDIFSSELQHLPAGKTAGWRYDTALQMETKRG